MKESVSNDAKKIYDGWEKIGLKNRIFFINRDKAFEEKVRCEEEEKIRKKEEERSIRNENGIIDYEKLDRLIALRKRDINDDLVRKHVQAYLLNDMLKKLKESKTNSEINKIQVNMIKSGLRDLKEKIEDMSKEEKQIEKPNKIVDIVEVSRVLCVRFSSLTQTKYLVDYQFL